MSTVLFTLSRRLHLVLSPIASHGRQIQPRNSRTRLLWIPIALLALGGIWGATRFRSHAQPDTLRPSLQPLPQDPYIHAYFNHSQANVYTDPYRNVQKYGDDLERLIVSSIDQAETSVDVAVQALDLPLIAQALIRSAQRGVKVRFILENQYAGESMPSEADDSSQPPLPNRALALLRESAIPILDDTADGSKGSGLMHHKFVVIDGRWVLTGSTNFTHSGIHGDLDNPTSGGNANALLKIDDRAIASSFLTEFDQMWGDGPGGRTDSKFGLQKQISTTQHIQTSTGALTLQFSPLSTTKPWQNSTNGLIARTLSQSKTRIDLALFVFSDQGIANQMQIQAASGTEVRTLIDPRFLYRSYSEALDMLGLELPDNRCRIEADNQPWQSPITAVGSPQLLPGDKLHHKFAIIDGTTIIIGSHNWSKAANTQNDEALLVIKNPIVAAHFSREFERLYDSAKTGMTAQLQRKMKEAKQRCS